MLGHYGYGQLLDNVCDFNKYLRTMTLIPSSHPHPKY